MEPILSQCRRCVIRYCDIGTGLWISHRCGIIDTITITITVAITINIAVARSILTIAFIIFIIGYVGKCFTFYVDIFIITAVA